MPNDHEMRLECAENFVLLLNHRDMDRVWQAEVKEKLERLEQIPVILAKIEGLEKLASKQDSRLWDLFGRVAGGAALVGVILMYIFR